MPNESRPLKLAADTPDDVLKIKLDQGTLAYLRDLAATGAYGMTIERVAEQLIAEGIREAINADLIEVKSHAQ